MSKVAWLPEALEDVVRLRSFLEDKSPQASSRAGAVIRGGAKTLADFPAIGKPMNDDTGRRELFLPFGAGGYILRYRMDQGIVVIMRAGNCYLIPTTTYPSLPFLGRYSDLIALCQSRIKSYSQSLIFGDTSIALTFNI